MAGRQGGASGRSPKDQLPIGEVARRSGYAASALRYKTRREDADSLVSTTYTARMMRARKDKAPSMARTPVSESSTVDGSPFSAASMPLPKLTKNDTVHVIAMAASATPAHRKTLAVDTLKIRNAIKGAIMMLTGTSRKAETVDKMVSLPSRRGVAACDATDKQDGGVGSLYLSAVTGFWFRKVLPDAMWLGVRSWGGQYL